jgi:hypothetical protein
MTPYTDADLHYGSGAFDHAMRAQTTVPGRAHRITLGAAVGTLSAAMRSGMPAPLLDQTIESDFAHSTALLKRVLTMYEGDDWDIHLWHLQPTGKFKLCTDLCRPGQIGWRYDRHASAFD